MIYKTEPFEHQRHCLRISAHREFFALFMEQGTGKSKIIIDNVAWLYLKRQSVNGLLILAPNGVHLNWVTDEIPRHMSDDVGWKAMVWKSNKAGTADFLTNFKRLVNLRDRLAILAMNTDAINTARGYAAFKTFLGKRNTFLAVDESADFRTPGSKRTRRLRTAGIKARFRRVLSGTPAPEGPFDLYPQMQFLSPTILKCPSAMAFKHSYGEFTTIPPGTMGARQTRSFEMLKRDSEGNPRFKNLDKLRALVDPHSFRVLKDEVFDLPPKLYTKRFFDMSPEQSRMYSEMAAEYETVFDTGELVTASIQLVRDLRLQQITSGYVPIDVSGDDDEREPEMSIPGPNPRLEVLVRTVQENSAKTIIWSRFRHDRRLIMKALRVIGRTPVLYDGTVSLEEKGEAKNRFQDGDATDFVSDPGSGGRGLTLTAAHTVIYYSNYFGLEKRLQSEDRAHRAGLNHSVLYVDIIATDTVDERIVVRLIAKKHTSDIIMSDPSKAWI